MRSLPGARFLPVVVVVAGLAGVVVVVAARPAPVVISPGGAAAVSDGSPPSLPVVGATAVCPDLLDAVPLGTKKAARLAGVTLDAATSGPVGGSVAVTADPGTPGVRELFTSGATTDRLTWPRSAGIIVLRASGPVSGGLDAVVTGTAPSGALARARCAPPSADTWFTGPGTLAGTDPLLVLTNTESVPARADVAILTPAGPAGDPDGTTGPVAPGIGVAPGATVTLRLAALAPEVAATAVHVTVRAGRLAATVLDRDSATPPEDAGSVSSIGPGTDVTDVPPAGSPASSVLLTGVPADAGGARSLVLAAPAGDATVRVAVIGPTMRYIPVGLDQVTVPAGTVSRIPVPAPGGGDAALLITVTSGGGVLAGLALASDPSGSGPRSWLSDGVLAGQASVPAVPEGYRGSLVLAATGSTPSVRLDGTIVPLAANRTVTVDLPYPYAGGVLGVDGGTAGATTYLRPSRRGGGPVAVLSVAGSRPTVPPVVAAADPRV